MVDQVGTADRLTQVVELLRSYVILPGDQFYVAVALWVLHSHAIGAADTSPRLILKSPEKESGKSRTLEVLDQIVPNPVSTFNATVAAIFRTLKEGRATLLLDEVDVVFASRGASNDERDLRAMLNSGWRRIATVRRVVGEGKKMHVEEFPVFAATALACLGSLPDTVESRSIIVPMRRRKPDELVTPFRLRRVQSELASLRESLVDWAVVAEPALEYADPQMPDTISDRAADCWEPLLAIAELAGGEWPQRAREAAVAIVRGRIADDASVAVRLLADIKVVMDVQQRLSSADLLNDLNSLEEASWGGWNGGKGMAPRDLARHLKPFGIESKNVRLSDRQAKGYERGDFIDAWSRYLQAGADSPISRVPRVPYVPAIRSSGTRGTSGTGRNGGAEQALHSHPSRDVEKRQSGGLAWVGARLSWLFR